MDKLILFYEIEVISISKYYLCKLQRTARQQIFFFIRTLLPNRCSFVWIIDNKRNNRLIWHCNVVL